MLSLHEKWWSSSLGITIPEIWKNTIHVPNHRPAIFWGVFIATFDHQRLRVCFLSQWLARCHQSDELSPVEILVKSLTLPSGNLIVCYWKWPIYSELSHEKWWFSIVMLVYQRPCKHVITCLETQKNISPEKKNMRRVNPHTQNHFFCWCRPLPSPCPFHPWMCNPLCETNGW